MFPSRHLLADTACPGRWHSACPSSRRLRQALRHLGALVLLTAVLFGAPDVAAQEAAASPAEAAARVEAQTDGRVLGVRRDGDVYLVKVLTAHGRVRIVTVPAR